MVQELDNIESPTFRVKIERMLVKKALQAKMFLGQGVYRKTKEARMFAKERAH